MKKLFNLIALIIFSSVIYAQTEDWLWANQPGGTGSGSGCAIATNNNGNSYVTGGFSGTATFGSTTLISSGGVDIFIAKLDTNGNYLWAKQAGGAAYDQGFGIATDSNGNTYVTGRFLSAATFGSISLVNSSTTYSDIFITKLDTNGNFLWAKKAGGTSYDEGSGIATDDNGNSYVTGYFSVTITFGTTLLTSSGGGDIFIAKLDSNGNYLWAKKAGGTYSDWGYSIATDSSGNSYVTGHFGGHATFGSATLISAGGSDIFIVKLSTSGGYMWAKRSGGTSEDWSEGIATDSSGNIYVTGSFLGTATFGTTTLANNGQYDIYIAKLDTNGNYLWAKQSGGISYDRGYGISTDSSGISFVTGYFSGTATFGTTQLTSSGSEDIFITKIDSSGNYLWATQTGGTGYDMGSGIASDSFGCSYVTGGFQVPVTFGTTTLISSESAPIFIAKNGTTYTVLAPNGGEIWPATTAQTVYWNFINTGSQVNVLLSVDNGENWIMLNSSPVTASLGRFSFTVPSITSSQCLIKVVSTTNSECWDVSDAPFTISSSLPASLVLTAPFNAKLQTGKSYAINWLATGVATVNLEYSLDAGVSWNSFAASLPASPGTNIWTVPETPAPVCYIRISDAGNPSVYDWNDEPFTISSLQLTSPNGGNLYHTGTSKYITWASAQVSNVKLEYSVNNGSSWAQIVASTTAATYSYSWTVPATASDQYQVRISDVADSAIIDSSDNVFTVAALAVSYPSATGIKLQVGRASNITWEQAFLPGTVKLDLTTDGSTWTNIATGVDASLGIYLWTVPDTPSSTCRIRVTSELDALVLDSSNNNFTISKLSLSTPNGYEIWGSGSVHVITWAATNVTNLKLEYSINDGNSWTQIVASVAAATGTYNWTVPTANSALCKVRITDTASAIVFDTSDDVFTIRPQITVTAPNGSEFLTVNSIYSILWTSTADVSLILIDYSINNGSSWLPIQTSAYPASGGRYDWIVPNNPSVNCLVKVRSSANSAIYDVSNAVFTITPLIQPPTVDFTADLLSGLEPLTVQFSDLSSAGTGNITNWLWEFGDGETAIIQNPLHVYNNHGMFSVTLTVTNSADSTASLCRQDYITVLPRYPELELKATSLQLGNVYLGSVSAAQDLWLKNIGTAVMAVDSTDFVLGSSPFEVVGLTLPIVVAAGDSTLIQLRFMPIVAGAVTDSLLVFNNSNNLPRAAIRLSGTGQYVPPLPPENVALEMDGSNAVISWDAVTETIFHTPIVPDYYLLFFNGSGNIDDDYYYLGRSWILSYVHDGVSLHSPNMFYRVRAYKYYGRGVDDFASLGLVPGMTEAEVIEKLTVIP